MLKKKCRVFNLGMCSNAKHARQDECSFCAKNKTYLVNKRLMIFLFFAAYKTKVLNAGAAKSYLRVEK